MCPDGRPIWVPRFTVVIHNYPSVAADRIIDTIAFYHKMLRCVKKNYAYFAFFGMAYQSAGLFGDQFVEIADKGGPGASAVGDQTPGVAVQLAGGFVVL